jgi:predicted NBD/HSP70 family sugar kinase
MISEFNIPLSLNRSLDPELEFLLFNNKEYRKGGTLLFHWGYGIGSAFAAEGKILKSSLGRFGELGHWKVRPDSLKQCSCGSMGCLETEAALWAILPEIREVYPDAPEDEPEFTNFLLNINIGNLEVIKKALGYVTVSLANLYKIFYPDRILLLGPFVKDSLIFNDLKSGLNTLIPEYARSSMELKVISGFQGAVSGSIYHLFRDALRPLLKTRGNV